MKKKILIFILIIVICSASYNLGWINYLLITTAGLAMVFLVLAGLISIFKKLKSRTFKIPLLIILICVIGIMVSFLRPYEEPIIESENLSENLEYAYKTDQKDRKELRSFIGALSKLKKRDSIRLKQVRDNYDNGKIATPIDKFRAAFIFHHGNDSKDFKIAAELAADAANSKELEDHYTAQWLRKASYDRYMLSIGKPQKYETQEKISIDFN